jgi:hypothetical protein
MLVLVLQSLVGKPVFHRLLATVEGLAGVVAL